MRDKLKNISVPINNNKEGALLSKLFRKILMDLNLTNKLEFLINRYIKTANDKNIAALKRKTRSSLVNNIVADEMTWKTFMDLTFNLLKVKKCKLSIELQFVNDTTSKHDLVVVKDCTNEDETKEKNNDR